MSRYSSTLSPTKITPEHLAALKQMAAKQQTNISQIVRLAIAEYLDKYNEKEGFE